MEEENKKVEEKVEAPTPAESEAEVSTPDKDQDVEKKPKEEPKATEKAKKEVKVPAKFKDLIKQIEGMSIMDLAELVKILEEKFGVSAVVAAAPVAGAVSDAEEGGEEKTIFAVELKDAGSQKIQTIKAVREITGRGLKESKDLVDKAPCTVKENIKKDEAEEIKKKLEDAGATVELK